MEFARKFLKDSPLFPPAEAGRWFEPAQFHYDLSESIAAFRRVILQLPRESGKSTWFSVIRVTRLICENRNTRIMLISKTQKIAMRFVGLVRRILEFNESLIETYGPFRPEDGAWRDDEFTVIRPAEYTVPTMVAVGRGGQIVSGRFDLVIGDDVEDYDATRTDERRLATFEWWQRDVVPVISAQGQGIIIQTPQHEADLAGQVRAASPVWKLINLPAERELPDPNIAGRMARVALWPEKWPVYWTDCAVKRAEERGGSEEHLFELARTDSQGRQSGELDGGACVNCAVYDATKGDTNGVQCLSGRKYELGNVFYRLSYLVDVQALGGDIFRPEWFRFWYPDELEYREVGGWHYLGRPLEIYLGIDPAIADEEEKSPELRSRFAAVVLGYAPAYRRRLVLHYENARVNFPTQKQMVIELLTTWRPRCTYFEDQVFQKALRQEIIDVIRKDHPALADLALVGADQDSDKFRRFAARTPEHQAGQVYVKGSRPTDDQQDISQRAALQRSPHQAYVTQFVRFPRGAHTDLMDGYCLASRGITTGKAFEDYARIAELEAARQEQAQQLIQPVATPPKPGEWTWTDLMRAGYVPGSGSPMR